jgi:hypothetical protein
MKVKVLLVIALALGLASAQNLLTNGDFEQDLTVGWTQTQGGGSYVTFDRSTDYQPDPDYEARDSIYSGNGCGMLSQTVDVPGPLTTLSFQAAFAIYGASSSCWPVACVTVGYCDASSNLLGETRYYYHDSYCTWAPTSTLSLINVTDPNWNRYELNVADELNQHLPGVNPGMVTKLRVALFDTTAGG